MLLGASRARPDPGSELVTLFLCGDVMLGRGIDQVLPHAGDPRIHEPYVKTALDYVELAERANGPIPRPVDFAYVWGDALEALQRVRPDVRLVNVETSVTKSDDYWRGKEIHYRMHPENAPCLKAAGIDCCALANNHVLDWGYTGLTETLETLRNMGAKTVGAGRNRGEAETPAILALSEAQRVLIFSFGSTTSGIPSDWAATPKRPGVNLLPDLSEATVGRIAAQVRAVKRPGDIVVASIHWGSNWGYDVPRKEKAFARGLIDHAGVDVIHGHSSHHPKGIEVYRDRPILYGCGDFITDYEGISGYEAFRGDLVLMYFATLDPSGRLQRLEMAPLQIKRFRLQRAAPKDAAWLRDMLAREGRALGTDARLATDNTLTLLF
ncbi:MAG TPA: CapA family protein [Gammaproteobacteria bacterium]|nr:CapA family protein [Gammaproteobacteria bacterium]